MHSIQPHSVNVNIESFQAGEERGFEYFFKYYYKRLCYFAGRYVQDKEAVEDIVSESFLSAWQRREIFTDENFLRNFLYKVVRNHCLRWLEKQQTEKKYFNQAILSDDTIERCFVESIVHTEFIHQVYYALEKLPPACRTIFKKLYMEGKSMKETAIELQLAKSTIQTQKIRGIGILREILFPAKG